MKWSRIVGRVGVAALLALVVSSLGCKKGSSNPDGGDGSIGDLKPNTDGMTGDRADVGGPETPVCSTTGTPKAQGDACACDGECASHFCADGVCCESACKEGCKTCNAPDTIGKCVMRKAGTDPRDSSTCMKTAASTCSFDGKCDGAGACRKYPENTMCKPGTCEGDAVVGSSVCDGVGHCKPGSTRICVPFTCNSSAGACFTSCTSSSQCISGQACVQGSCGKLMSGASCETGDQCASGFCADKICCNVACKGPCLSCNLAGREGRCWPLDADAPDSRGICRDQGKSSCGQTGFCDGIGGCSKYPRDTVCIAPTCSGNAKVNTAGTCDGLGTCQGQGIQDCHPFRCASGACTKTCATSADCDTGIACVNNTCGPKQDGQICTGDAECQHNHCVDGVCCDQACTGPCRSCGLAASMGRCTPIAAGSADPRGMCKMMAQSTCSTNGKCDGGGNCQSWPVGTLCADETCSANVYKAPSTCNATGQCVAPDLLPCSPYVCNGSRCFNACTNNTQCLTPNSCTANSCGKKENGAMCSTADECKSTFCAQGVCCDQACTGACKSCVAAMLGVCTNVATGTIDPAGICAMQDVSTCGTNGKCEAGACQRWASGTPCKPATCPSATMQGTALSTCDGAGTCVTPGARPCFPFICGTDACLPSCTADNQCQSPAVCVNGSCGLKSNGAVCLKKEECLSNFCEQGVCCESACTGTCKSCALGSSRGVCSNVAAGDTDLLSRCADQGAPSCGTDGKCDGKGACRLYDASTSCAAPSCPGGQSTAVTGRTCNGLGVCQPANNIPCAPYVCNGATACLAACTRDADCLPPYICDPKTNRCGNLKRPGQPCAATSECLTGLFCVDGVCCVSSGCSLCTSCNVGASAGNCANVPLGQADPMNRCAANPPCGNTGFCNGAAGCQLAATTVSCSTESCTGSTYTPISHCNGTGACSAATSSSCTPYLCGGATCRTNCAMDSHCVAPYTCQGTPPNRSCALKPNGTTCGAGNECISGSCVNGVCCGSSACGTCQTCNGTAPGTCTPLAAGTTAPSGQCTAAPPCGNTGRCNGASGCEQAPSTTSCGPAMSCTGMTYQPPSTCTGIGACAQQPTQSCGNYVCSGTSCLTSCTADTQCASTTLYCTGNTTAAGTCTSKKGNGAACGAAHECTTGNCTDGVCCTTTSCGTCQSCAASGNGTCGNVADNSADPRGRCPAGGECGNTGVCVSGACQQQPASKTCGTAQSCTGATYQPPSHCTGSGTCSQQPTQSCGSYVCNGSSCRTDCTSDSHCSDQTNLYCTGNATTPGTCDGKKANGGACTANNQCSSSHCTDGVCCTTDSCGACQMCNLNGAGTCSAFALGTPAVDPYGRCSNSGPCGNTGFCLNGSCMQQATTTPCGPAVMCMSGMYQPQSFCSGAGLCNTMSPTGCGAYVCNGAGTACLGSCNTANGDADCASGYYCSGGTNTCLPKKAPGGGNTCSAGHECTTGFCVDGFCCGMSACGTCQTCASGTCGNSTDGQPEPHGGCTANLPCGNTGTCTGGACTQGAAGTQCVAPFCADAATFQPEAKCNGLGTCSVPATQGCAPYTCGGGTGCRGGCADDTQCVGNTYCDAGVCRTKKSAGDGCGRDGECGGAYNHCTEGVCCNSAQCDSCQTCTASGSAAGSCHNVPGGLGDPRGMCANQGAASCGTNGLCNGAGNCARYDTSTECMTACNHDLLNTIVTHTFCDGAGMCAGLTIPELCLSLMCTDTACTP